MGGFTLDAVSATDCVATNGGGLQIDLSPVSFAMPGGLVAVACLVTDAWQAGTPVFVTPPRKLDAALYASRMGLGGILRDCGFHDPFPSVTHHPRQDVLYECEWIDDAGLEDLATLVNDRMWEAGVEERTIDLIAAAVYELASNVHTHAAAGGGFICAQTFRRGTPQERVEVAVGDAGCGIRSTIERRHRIDNDAQALRLAVNERVSGLSDRRGLGLHYIARDIPAAGGKVTLRSGSAFLHVFPGGPYSSSCAPIVGTLVEVSVPVGGLAKPGTP